MTRALFDRQMQRLGVLKFPPEKTDGHYEVLARLPEAVLEAAVGQALRTRATFPVPAELLADADVVAVRPSLGPEPERAVALAQPFTVTIPEVGTVVSVTREWRYYCDRCSDIGWATWWCGAVSPKPWIAPSRCERHGAHDPHEFVSQCACWESNPALIRRREAQRKYASDPAKVSR